MPLHWNRTTSERVLETSIFEVARERLVSPRTGQTHDFFILTCVDWCNIVPITRAGEVVMVRQFRHGTREETLELPGGMVDSHDATPLDAARRELREETGYHAERVEPIGVIAPNPAMMSNRCHSFLARDVERHSIPTLDAGEDIEVVTVPLSDIPIKIARGEICHALVVVAFAFAMGLRAP